MKTTYIIRHGESEHNAHTMYKLGGKTENSSLTLRGINQAHRLGERLKAEEITFDKIYSSVMNRAKETAEIVAKKIGYPLEKIIYSDTIIEQDHGDVTGRLREEIYTPEFREYLENHSWEFSHPNGESQKVVAERMIGFIDQVVEESAANHTVAIFTHGTATKALLCKIMGFHPRYVYNTHIDNTAITELQHNGKNHIIRRINDYAHLSRGR
jgi:broad specificity phosphatase PhoE